MFFYFLRFTSHRLGLLKCLAQGHSHKKPKRIKCGSQLGLQDYKLYTLPLGHAGPPICFKSLFSCFLQIRIVRLTLSQTIPGFYVSAVQVFRKHCGKRRNCSLRAISPFSTVFSTLLENFLPFSSKLRLSFANSFSLEKSKICHSGKG